MKIHYATLLLGFCIGVITYWSITTGAQKIVLWRYNHRELHVGKFIRERWIDILIVIGFIIFILWCFNSVYKII